MCAVKYVKSFIELTLERSDFKRCLFFRWFSPFSSEWFCCFHSDGVKRVICQRQIGEYCLLRLCTVCENQTFRSNKTSLSCDMAYQYITVRMLLCYAPTVCIRDLDNLTLIWSLIIFSSQFLLLPQQPQKYLSLRKCS